MEDEAGSEISPPPPLSDALPYCWGLNDSFRHFSVITGSSLSSKLSVDEVEGQSQTPEGTSSTPSHHQYRRVEFGEEPGIKLIVATDQALSPNLLYLLLHYTHMCVQDHMKRSDIHFRVEEETRNRIESNKTIKVWEILV